MTRRPALCLGAALVVLVSACGVPLDKEPQAIGRSTTSTTATPTTRSAAGASAVAVYFLQDDHLVAQSYPVSGQPTLAQAITFALQPPAEGSPTSIRTAVPPDTRLLSAAVSGTVASIDLGNGISAVNGESQKQAFAQLVFTALAFNVERVQFSIEGKPVDAPTDGANKRRVSATDYAPPLRP